MATKTLYQFYAELDEFTPKIWRRFQVEHNITVARLGYIVQVLFEMTACHLMVIEVPRGANSRLNRDESDPDAEPIDFGDKILRYEIPDIEDEPYFDFHRNVSIRNAVTEKLKSAVSNPGDKLTLNYDYGDDWWMTLVLEKVLPGTDIAAAELPRVLEGENFGIIEDVGGVFGLKQVAEAFKKKRGADYKRFSEWMGVTDFDINAFDLDDMNFRVKKIPRIYKQSYEDGKYPTSQSIALIERDYLRKQRG